MTWLIRWTSCACANDLQVVNTQFVGSLNAGQTQTTSKAAALVDV